MAEEVTLLLAVLIAMTVAVAVLLGLVFAVAKSIDRRAHEIFVTGKELAGNTVSIWLLERTNEQLKEMARVGRSVEATAAAIVERLPATSERRD